MDSRPRVYLSKEQEVQAKSRILSSSSSSGSFLIRAPLTIDDDDDDNDDNGSFISEANSDRMVVASDSGYGSSSTVSSNGTEEGFVSGDDFETASERPFVADPDEEIVEESGFVDKYKISRPFVAVPDEEIVEESGGFVDNYKFSRPSVSVVDEEIVEESGGFVDKYEFSRPFVAEPDGEFSEKSVVNDEESGIGDDYDGPVVNLSLVESVNIKPIAQLSMDDDGFEFDELSGGEEGVASEVEYGVFSSVVKVPSVGRVDSAPRIKVMDIEGGEDEPLSGLRSPQEFADGSVLSKFVGVGYADLGYSAEFILIDNSENDSVSDELVEVKGNSSAPEAHNESFVNGKEDVSEFGKNSVEQVPALQNSVLEKIESNDRNAHNTEEDSAGIAFAPVLNHFDELKVEEAEGSAEEPSDCQNNQCSSFDDSRGFSLVRNSGQDNLESSAEPEIDLGVHLYDQLAIISCESMDGAVNGKRIQTVDSNFSEPNTSLQGGDLHAAIEGDRLEDAESRASRSLKFVNSSISSCKAESEAEDDTERFGRRGLLSDEDVEELVFGSSGATKQVMNGLEERLSSSSLLVSENSQDHSQGIDGQFVLDTDDKLNTNRNGEEYELSESAAVVALLKSANSVALGGGEITIASADDSKVLALERPPGSGSTFPSSRSILPPNMDGDASKANLSEEEKRRIDRIHVLRVKFLRLVKRLGYSYDDSIVVQVLYRLALGFGGHSGEAFSTVTAKRVAAQHGEENKDDLDFWLNILVIGKTGVGKSATINSIFCEEKGTVDAFEPATTSVKVIAGTIHGVKIRILDTPGLRSPVMGQNVNMKILTSIKKSMKKFPPDVVLYVDRLDTHTGDYNNLPLLRSLTNSLGSSIWQNAIVCLTHAASDPPDGPSGLPLSYELYVAQRSHVIQQSISQAVDNLLLMNPNMMHPVSLVENHQSCRKNQTGESVLPNGQSWRPHLLLLCFSLKILSEGNSVSKPQDPFIHKKFSAFRRSAPLSYFLSSLLQSGTHPKLSADQGGNDVDSDVDLGDLSDSEQEDEDEYDQLPPFKALRKSQVAKLSKEQREAYFEEYDYRVKLLQKKLWKEEVKRFREIKKKSNQNNIDYRIEEGDREDESPATVPVMLPDFVLPPSFDGDNPAYRYRFLEPTSQLLVRPVLDSHSWDHDCGYDGVSLERNFAIASQFPGAFSVQITKDKKEFNIHLDSSISAKHGENGSTMAGLDIQTVGRQLAYVLRGETKIRNFKINKTSAGLSVTLLGKNLATGLKIEDQIAVGKRLVLTGNAGTVQSRSDTAYGANLELRLKDKDFPMGQDNSSLGLSMVNWRGDPSLTANLQSQFSTGRSSKMVICVGLNNKQSGQITVKLSSSEQLQMTLIGVLPIAMFIFRSICPGTAGANTSH